MGKVSTIQEPSASLLDDYLRTLWLSKGYLLTYAMNETRPLCSCTSLVMSSCHKLAKSETQSK